MLKFKKAKDMIDMSNTIYIVAHQSPDGDAIGSTFAMYLALKRLGKKVNVVLKEHSKSFDFMPHLNEAKSEIKSKYDLLIALDSSDKSRLATEEKEYSLAKNVLMIDHHKEKELYGDVCIVDSKKPAVSELVYDFLKYMKIDIDEEIAMFLYMGIITDTGSLSYSSTTPNTFKVVSKLIETGIDFSRIMYNLNNSMSEAKLKLIAKTIENMEVYEGGRIRYSYVDYETIRDLGIDEEDAEGMTNYLRSVKGTDVAIYVRGKSDGSLKVSLRASEKVDVSTVAIKLGGGGHMRAAGYTMKDNIDVGKEIVINEFRKML